MARRNKKKAPLQPPPPAYERGQPPAPPAPRPSFRRAPSPAHERGQQPSFHPYRRAPSAGPPRPSAPGPSSGMDSYRPTYRTHHPPREPSVSDHLQSYQGFSPHQPANSHGTASSSWNPPTASQNEQFASMPRGRSSRDWGSRDFDMEAPSGHPLPDNYSSEPVNKRRSKAGARASDHATPPAQPVPSERYLAKSSEASVRLPKAALLLVILDMNGTLLYRSKGKNAFGSDAPILRPGVQEFLAYLFRNFEVMVWTSARPENAARMVNATFSKKEREKLLATWARDTLGLTKAQYNAKVQVYKTLDRVWEGEFMISPPGKPDGAVFDQTNTVLFDDSTEKAAAHPYNLVKIPEFKATHSQKKNDRALSQCIDYLDILKWESNVSAFMCNHPFVYETPKEGSPKRKGRPEEQMKAAPADA